MLCVKPPYRIVDAFIRRLWGKFRIDKVVISANGVFIVRFRALEGKQRALDVGPILYDNKHVIRKSWSPDIDLLSKTVKVVPIWIKLPWLPLK